MLLLDYEHFIVAYFDCVAVETGLGIVGRGGPMYTYTQEEARVARCCAPSIYWLPQPGDGENGTSSMYIVWRESKPDMELCASQFYLRNSTGRRRVLQSSAILLSKDSRA